MTFREDVKAEIPFERIQNQKEAVRFPAFELRCQTFTREGDGPIFPVYTLWIYTGAETSVPEQSRGIAFMNTKLGGLLDKYGAAVTDFGEYGAVDQYDNTQTLVGWTTDFIAYRPAEIG